MKPIWNSKLLWASLIILNGFTVLLWWQRGPILAWYHVRQLSYAYQDNCESCARRVAALEETALPGVLEALHDGDAVVCSNMQRALELMVKKWGAHDERCHQLIFRLHAEFASFRGPGQEKTLLLLTMILQAEGGKPWPAPVTRAIGELMTAAEQKPELRTASMLLAAELLDCVPPGEWLAECKAMAERGLADPLCAARIAAVQLLMRSPLRKDKQLLARAVPLLRDAESAVRRVALLALASENEVVREDALMSYLHDDDSEVQELCELALRKRGLTDDDIRLARLISDTDPAVRMRVLLILPQMRELNLREWLRQLSLDPAPALRAAAVRAAAENPTVDLSDRLREIALNDPSDAVRMNAQFYLRQRAGRVPIRR
jgi:hypothetical protein